MRFAVLAIAWIATLPLAAQPVRGNQAALGLERIEAQMRQLAERLADEKKAYERDVRVLALLRAADEALVDPMQPAAAIQKALENVSEAERLGPPFTVMQGVIASRQALESARLSPGSANFGRLRDAIRRDAAGPAARTVLRNTARLQEEIRAWLRVQDFVTQHLGRLAEIADVGMREIQAE
jgi:hypothetical protein